MGNASGALNKVKDFARDVSKVVIKEATGKIPVIGAPLGNLITNSYAVGGDITDSSKVKTMEIKTPSQLLGLVKKYPEIAEQHGLTVQDIKDVASGKAVGGDIFEESEEEEEKPKKKKMTKKKRTPAQIAATKRLVEMNKKRRGH
jgi:hypothetical protein